MKRKGERNIPNFSKKPTRSHPVASDRQQSPPATPPARAPQPKPQTTSAKSGRRGQ
jgi:hypothetical protein